MHPLIERAKNSVRSWSSDQPRDLAISVASFCREILDAGELPVEGQDWGRLRQAFDFVAGQPIGPTIAEWDDLCRFGHFDVISNREAYVKLGIITWTVKLLLKKLGILTGPKQEMGLEEWKAKLVSCLDKYILVPEKRTSE
jgi:hypothetical protein